MNRFEMIMSRVDQWAEENEVWDCRADAVQEVEWILNHNEYKEMSDDDIFEQACQAWLMAE